VLVETSRALPVVSITVGLRSGSVQDPPGREGALRFMSRLMRRTAAGLPAQVVDTRIDSLGGSLGADVSFTTLSFHGTVIARSVEPFVDVMLDVLSRPGFADEEFGRLQREINGEIVETRDNDRALARRWFRRKLFGQHQYGRTISGTQKSVAALTPAQIRELYAQNFVGGNLVFAFAGDITEEGAQRIAERISNALPGGPGPASDVPEPNVRSGRHLVIVDKPERTQTQILIGGLGTHPADPDHVALHVANTIFGGTFTARMTREIRSKRGWSYGAYSSLPIDRRRQSFSMWTFPKAEDAAPCIALQLDLLEQWREKGVTKTELGWAKRYLARSHAFTIDTASKRVGLKLDSELYGLPPGYYDRFVEHVQAVTLDQANAAIRERISTDNLLVAVLGTSANIGDAIRQAIPRLETVEVVSYDSDDY
jgi:zinc protease